MGLFKLFACPITELSIERYASVEFGFVMQHGSFTASSLFLNGSPSPGQLVSAATNLETRGGFLCHTVKTRCGACAVPDKPSQPTLVGFCFFEKPGFQNAGSSDDLHEENRRSERANTKFY
jgi:hypothetical protein